MKTTIELTDSLLIEAKKFAANQHLSLRKIFEMALRRWLESQRPGKATPFRLKKHPFRGQGLQPGLSDGSWEEMRKQIYENHGG